MTIVDAGSQTVDAISYFYRKEFLQDFEANEEADVELIDVCLPECTNSFTFGSPSLFTRYYY